MLIIFYYQQQLLYDSVLCDLFCCLLVLQKDKKEKEVVPDTDVGSGRHIPIKQVNRVGSLDECINGVYYLDVILMSQKSLMYSFTIHFVIYLFLLLP